MSEDAAINKIMKLTAKKKSEKVVKYLKDKDVEVVKAAIAGLGQIKDETSVNQLAKLIEDQNPEIQKAAIVAFAGVGSEYAKSLLQHLITKVTNQDVKEVAMQEVRNFKIA